MRILDFNKFCMNESMSDVLYHFTRTESLVNMLRDNEINLTMAVGSRSDLDINMGRFFFLSMQTTRNSGYGYRRTLPVMLVMDGRALNSKYKGGPVDYWQSSGNYKVKHDMDEFEQRLVANKGTIPFDKNVREVHVLVDESSNDDMKLASAAKRHAEKMGMPIFFYNDKVAYFNNAKGRAIDVDPDAEDPAENDWLLRDYGAMEILGLIAGTDKGVAEKLADEIISSRFPSMVKKHQSKTEKQSKEDIMRFFEDFADKWRLAYPSEFWLQDMYSSVSADIHNARDSRNKMVRWAFEKLVTDMRRIKAKDLKDYINKKYHPK